MNGSRQVQHNCPRITIHSSVRGIPGILLEKRLFGLVRLIAARNSPGHDPVRPAPSKRLNQSEATFIRALPESDGLAASDGEQRLQLFAPLLEGFGPPIAVYFARQVEKASRTLQKRGITR